MIDGNWALEIACQKILKVAISKKLNIDTRKVFIFILILIRRST